MATAVSTLTLNGYPNGRDNTQRREIAYGVCALSAGGTYATNGIALTWSQVQGILTTKAQPQDAWFYSALGGGYNYVYDKTHNTLRILNGGTELANGASITADTINFKAEWLRGL